ncbi:YbaB/EbfC family nucleoid-associated protein [Murdochiella massiliensis]|uniref:YbaB/EbfC family nucleoid-associated protein n=1 Tax=Murdochiella massiliensis TaxID=1673723 RepID=UPI00083304E5|nr:YbaB/EbfC family nucleoid-associated protein [Murdochiella massiliensis]MBY0584469.1 YbaB/EbfC family nucleoid-associated protein [Murdochiella sp. Marseille-P8839]
MKGFKGPRSGNNMNNMMKKMQRLQRQMEETQQKIDATEIETSAGGGVVKVKMNGKHELLELVIDPEVVDPEDTEMLADLVMVAVNDAIQQATALNESEMGRLTGGMNIPGL